MGNWHWRLELWDDLKLSVKTFFSCINRRTNHAVITHRKILLENLESLDHTLKRATVRNVFQKSIRNYKEHWKGSRTNHINHYDLRCVAVKLLVAQSCLTLCNPMDCSLPDSSIHGILQARWPSIIQNCLFSHNWMVKKKEKSPILLAKCFF